MRFIRWIKEEWTIILFVAALALATSYSTYDYRALDADQHQQLVDDCIATSLRSSVAADGWHRLALRVGGRDNPGDSKSAETYEAVANSLLDQIPAPIGLKDLNYLAELDTVTERGRIVRFRLTPHAKELQRVGCEQAFR